MRRGCRRLLLSVDHTPPRATALTVAHTLAPVDLILPAAARPHRHPFLRPTRNHHIGRSEAVAQGDK
jgi:hypothetical protein